MNREQFEKVIFKYVQKNPGCKAMVLIADISHCVKEFDQFDKTPLILEDMVSRGLIREEEYTDPDMPYRIKSRLYPAVKN